MDDHENTPSQAGKSAINAGTGVAIGSGVGTAVGVALGEIALGLAFGAGLGAAIGGIMSSERNGTDPDTSDKAPRLPPEDLD